MIKMKKRWQLLVSHTAVFIVANKYRNKVIERNIKTVRIPTGCKQTRAIYNFTVRNDFREFWETG